MYSPAGDALLRAPSCLIRVSPDQRLLAPPRSAFVACHALHRPSVPRHPPCALRSFAIWLNILDFYQRYAIVKVRPPATCERGPVSPQLVDCLGCRQFGGDGRDRTGDLRRARAALSRLSYVPMVGESGIEPPTSPLSGARSNRLSYSPTSVPLGADLSALRRYRRGIYELHQGTRVCPEKRKRRGMPPLPQLRRDRIIQ